MFGLIGKALYQRSRVQSSAEEKHLFLLYLAPKLGLVQSLAELRHKGATLWQSRDASSLSFSLSLEQCGSVRYIVFLLARDSGSPTYLDW
jgi:hypothetical protein